MKSNHYKILKHLTIYIFLFLVLLTSSNAVANEVEVTQEMEWAAFDASQWQSPIVTYNNNIYFAWVNNRLQTMIAKKSPNGQITTNIIENNTDRNKHHTLPSLGIDKDGYIHVVYNMHHSRREEGSFGWQYKRSTSPESITAFRFVNENSANTIPGRFITYPSFVTDRERELYVTFRHRTPRDGNFNRVGSQGLGIAKYNANTRTWKMLGGTNYKHREKTFFWSDSSRISKTRPVGYHSYLADIFFDQNNRMHISWDVFINPGEDRSHIMYAYSDDGGETFRKANGSLIRSLPITPNNGDIVEQSPKGIFRSQTSVGVTSQGRPIVSFLDKSKNNQAYFKIWNGRNWGNKKTFPGAFPPTILSDSNGEIITFNRNSFFRSSNNGDTWQAYSLEVSNFANNTNASRSRRVSIETSSTSFDYEHFRSTRELRLQTTNGNRITVYTARFPNISNPNTNRNRNNSNQKLRPPTKIQVISAYPRHAPHLALYDLN